MQKEDTSWFASWFDSPYYHVLYKDRDDSEAADFMDRLTQYLHLHPSSKILDLACGKGRHSRYLSSLGYDVTGVDLSTQSITFAKKFEKENLKFAVHDMCLPYKKGAFNTVFNLFTSFGYFQDEMDNFKVIQTIKSSLKQNGIGVIDYMNSPLVIDNLIAHNSYESDGIKFELKRNYKDGFITKNIEVNDDGNSFHFEEKVRAFTFQDFETMLSNAGLHLLDCFGNYNLEPFNSKTSERLILIFMSND